MTKTRRGFTVVEMLVVAVMIFLIFYYIYKMLTPGIAAWRRGEMKVNLQQNTMLALYRLKNELEESNQNTVLMNHYKPATDRVSTLICFASARDTNGIIHSQMLSYGGRAPFDSGIPAWQKYVIYYLDSKFNLRRFETSSYAPYRSTDSMKINCDPITLIKVDDHMSNTTISRQIEDFTTRYNPSPEDWKGGIDLSITAVYRNIDGVEQFRTKLETTLVVKYDDLD